MYLQDTLEGPIEQQNLSLPSHISELMGKIVNPSIGNLFFINYQIQGGTRKEWRLVKIELAASLKSNP